MLPLIGMLVCVLFINCEFSDDRKVGGVKIVKICTAWPKRLSQMLPEGQFSFSVCVLLGHSERVRIDVG